MACLQNRLNCEFLTLRINLWKIVYFSILHSNNQQSLLKVQHESNRRSIDIWLQFY